MVVAADGTLSGDREHPANFGRLCSKGAALGETLGLAGRLLYPQIDGASAAWDIALDRIAGTFAQIIAEHGPDAVGLYASGQFLTEDYYVANKLMKGFIGTANIDTNSRLCMASSVAGHIRAFGEDVVPGCYEDIDEADLVILIGSNAAWCHPVLYRRLEAARQSRGTRVVVIDPRRTATCDIADLHLAIRPGSDVAVFNGLLAHLADQGACDRDWIGTHTSGFGDALEAARNTALSLADVADLADVPAADLARFYDWFAATGRSVSLYSQGVNQSSAGTDKVNAIINCHLATGRIGRPGMGPFSLTGQPNAMGGREVGGLANQLAAHMRFENPADVERVGRFWGAPNMATRPGLKAVDLFDAVLDGRVKALWIMGTNPAASMPRASRVRRALEACPFVVVSDCWPTDTSAFADVILPALGWSEKDGTVTNSERRISRQRAFRAAPGEARADWWMLAQVARRMGWETSFAYRTSADIFREHAALSGFENGGGSRRVFDISALAELDDAEYGDLTPTQWPLPLVTGNAACPSPSLSCGPDPSLSPRVRGEGRDEGLRPPFSAGSAQRLFSNGEPFPTPDGRARFVATPYRAPVAAAGAQWPLLLNTGRVRDQWHTMTRTGLSPRLTAHQREPFLDLHPDDACRIGLVEGGFARVESPHGETVMPVRLSTDQRPGEAFAAMHWTDAFSSAGPVDRLVSAAADPVSGQPELKLTAVQVTPVAALWRGLILRHSQALPTGPYYWARVPLQRGHAFDLAGWMPLPSGRGTEDWIVQLLGAPEVPELVIYADPARGAFRYASLVNGRLDSCLFLARNLNALPSREAIAALFGNELDLDARVSILSGRQGAGGGSRGRTICACFGVGLQTLHDTIASRSLTTVADIGAALRAGTNCGSCLPELKAILRDVSSGATLAA